MFGLKSRTLFGLWRFLGLLIVVARRPNLWFTAVRAVKRFGLVPDINYMRFRMLTMYGDAQAQPQSDDLLAYLRWCKDYQGRVGKLF
ncbi:MAG: hypothetical protein F4138_03755 [Acidimicrobiia bacterium]|nr:hypothetical protein [Acidimicrobiia bacterium]MYC56973.1 hypothetical protein [Acidimicrobiia bacterium]MYG94095.1 hypothetical protein [Acidimicrobiia bacterium]MYI30838.1 hypothetical protein [Acidimicrobiia bacterium]